MWSYSAPIRPDELYHHGVRGQKWGIRRYQNSDGSLTDAGRKKYEKLDAKEQKILSKKSKLTGNQNESDSKSGSHQTSSNSKAKPVKSMTNDELRAANERMTLEISYHQKYRALNPTKISAGKKFVNTIVDKAPETLANSVVSAVGDVEKDALKKQLRKAAKLENDNNKDKKDKD